METKFVRHGKLYDTETAALIGDSGWILDHLSDYPDATKRVKYYLTPNGSYFWVGEYKRPAGWFDSHDENYHGMRVLDKSEAIDFMSADGIDVSHLATLA